MSDDEETYSTVFSALRHPVRRRILRILARGPNSFTEIQRDVDVGSSHFNYHLDGLGELVVKTEDRTYRLSSSGRAALGLMEGVEEPEFERVRPSRGLLRSMRSRYVVTVMVVALLAWGLVSTAASLYMYQASFDADERYRALEELYEEMYQANLDADERYRALEELYEEIEERYRALTTVELVLNQEDFRSGDTLVFTVVNRGISKLTLGDLYEIEYLFEGHWKPANWLIPAISLLPLVTIPPGESFSHSVELFPVYEGTYRFRKEFSREFGGMREVVSAEFRVLEETPMDEIPEIPRLPEWFTEELESFCADPSTMSRMEVMSWLLQKGSEVSDLYPPGFITGHGYGLDYFFVDVNHATAAFVEQWPADCRGVEIRIEVYSWALTELRDVWREELAEANMQGLLLPEEEMPSFFARHGRLPRFRTRGEVHSWRSMLTALGDELDGADVPYWGGLVVSHGVGADGYYWIGIAGGRVPELDQAVILEIAQEVNRVAEEIGFTQEVPLKFSEATGEGGYFDSASIAFLEARRG